MGSITLYDRKTGILAWVINDSDRTKYEHMPFVEGAYDGSRFMVDVETGDIIDRPPPKPLYGELRQRRDQLLEENRWTIMPDSPLSIENQADWLLWLKAIQAILKDITDETTDTVVWPDQPEFIYAT